MGRWRKRVGLGFLAAALAAPLALAAPPESAQELLPPSREMREAYAFLLGLSAGTAQPEADGDADVYLSIPDVDDAPRFAVRMEISGNWCRVRTISALQFPGEWAVMTLKMIDFAKVEKAVGYATVDDLMAQANPIDVRDPRTRQVVLVGEGLECSSRLTLDESRKSAPVCGNRLDISMMDDEQVAVGRNALALAAETCDIAALAR